MRKSQNVKVKGVGRIAGSASGLGLLLLAFLLANPLMGLSASALEGSEDVGDSGESAAQAEVLTSTVSFAFGEPVGVTTLTPVSESGASARYSVKATVGVENSGGYTVYLGSNKSELTGKNSGATINGVTSSSSYESLPVNSWGYNATEGETAGTSFSRMPENVRGVALGGNDASNIKSDSKTFMLSFAAHIGNDKPADTYENEVTLSVVSSPLEITNAFGIETMQEMTAAICAKADVGTTDRLKDVRDDKLYWVAKLPDNNCWMTQNLDLNIASSGFPSSTTTKMSYQNSDMATAWTGSSTYPPTNTEASLTSSSVSSTQTTTRSWEQGMYVITDPTGTTTCGTGKANIAACPSQFTSVGSRTPSSDPDFYANNGNKTFTTTEYDAHYLVGNSYQWNTATAGTGGTISSGQAASSICPKGWRLPTSTGTGDFQKLITAGAIGVTVDKLTVGPYFFVRGGLFWQSASELFGRAGYAGFYWSSTPASGNDAYFLRFEGTNSVNASYYQYYGRYFGFSMRCVAR